MNVDILTVIACVTALVNITVVIWVMFILRGNSKRLDVVETENKSIKNNYLDRFEKTNKNITDVKVDIIDRINQLNISQTKVINDLTLATTERLAKIETRIAVHLKQPIEEG